MSAGCTYDVVVVGGGNAALCAAIEARDLGASVLLLERAPEAERGGNSSFTEMIRFAYSGADDIRALCPDLTDAEVEGSDFGTYTEEQFFDDMARTTQDRTDPDLCEIMIRSSNATMHWLRRNGVTFLPNFGKQAFRVEGVFRFFGGLTLEMRGGGQGLVAALYATAVRKGVEIRYETWVRDLVLSAGGVSGVIAHQGNESLTIRARSVVLACGGFESNAAWRTRYLGPGWDMAKVRGTRFNNGDGLEMAMRAGASPCGQWSGCHAVSWERYASEFGDLERTPSFFRHSYPFSVMINADGKRFLDEGADLRNYTYAKYGEMVLRQPGHFAYQVYDGKIVPMLRAEYRKKYVTKVQASSIEELAERLDGVDKRQFIETIREFNMSIDPGVPFRPDIKDGRCTRGLAIPKSNWANPIDTPPFEAYAVTCAITFTYGGLRINRNAEVLDTGLLPMPGLYAAGEIVGGLFYFNYPGGSGLMSGAVFGRIAGSSAAGFARSCG